MNGFRALIAGAKLESFRANPVMLYQHHRGIENGGGQEDAHLPIGAWYDINIVGNKVEAKPDFDDEDEMAMKISGKVERGYLRGASIWILPLAISDDPALMLPGQTLPTITEWEILECSIVDIPNCRTSLARKNKDGKLMALSVEQNNDEVEAFLLTLPNQNTNMKKEVLALKLGIPSDSADNAFEAALDKVLGTSSKLAVVEQENTNLKLQVKTLESKIANTNIEALVQGAIDAGKIGAGQKEDFVKLAQSNFDQTKAVLDSMPVAKSIESQLGDVNEAGKAELQELTKLSGNDIYNQGKFPRLKELSATIYKLKYKEAFGVEPTA
jgi:hypothetical protein